MPQRGVCSSTWGATRPSSSSREQRRATPQQRAADKLHGALEALAAIGLLVSEGRERFEANADRRAHLCSLWVVVGSRRKNHCAVLDISRATGAFAMAIAFRQKLACERPSKRDDGLVWTASVEDTPKLSRDATDTLAAIA